MAELALCERLGVSHSHFLGGPVDWTAQDREKALALHRFKASLCPCGCGTERSEWDPEQGGHEEAYIGQIDHPGTRMARIALRPTRVALLDFQTRLPRALGGLTS